MNVTSKKNRMIILVVLFNVALGLNQHLQAQQIFGLSYGYEVFPHVKLTDPIPGNSEFEIQASSWDVGAAFPLMFGQGKTIVMNQFNYKRTDLNYRNSPSGATLIAQMQSMQYTFFMIDSLNHKWKMVVVLTPGLASDFEGDLVKEDFTFGGVFGFIRQYGKNLQIGCGLAYMPDFGEPLPMPFVYLDWNISSRMNLNGILPTNMLLKYQLNPKFDVGLSLKVQGNRYHGNPEKFGVDNPLMKYSEGTFSPMLQYHFNQFLHLNVEGGYAFYRNFEFFDGDTEAQSLDLKQTGYIRTRLVIGI